MVLARKFEKARQANYVIMFMELYQKDPCHLVELMTYGQLCIRKFDDEKYNLIHASTSYRQLVGK